MQKMAPPQAVRLREFFRGERPDSLVCIARECPP